MQSAEKILITGGSGLVGGELISQLIASGKKVTAIYHKTPLSIPSSSLLKQIHCDILDTSALEEIMQDIQYVYHCAGLVSFNNKHRNDLSKINIEGTANMVNASLEAGVKKMLFVSSVAALGSKRNGAAIDETINWNGEESNSVYAQSKYMAEMEVWRGIAEGLNAVIVNPSTILGPGDWRKGSSQLFKSVYDEFPWYSDGVTGFVDVRDVAKAMIQLMESDINAERFIISADNKSYEELFKLISKEFGKKPPHKKVTPFLAQMVWRIESIKSRISGKDPLVTKETASRALNKIYFDNSKLKKFLPQFQYLPVEQTVAHTCAALLQKF